MYKDFLQGREIEQLIRKAEEIKNSDRVFSDIVDEKGCQYVDLVQEGGGVLGIGLVGYIYILEQAGIRFYSLAGTSAGAVNTMLMAGLKKIGEPVSEVILDILSEKNLFDFVDGPESVNKLIQRKIEGKNIPVWRWIWNLPLIYYLLRYKLGLNPGRNFAKWLTKKLREAGVGTYDDLQKKRLQLPNLRNRINLDEAITPAEIAMITAEVTTHTKIEFPKMAELYWKKVGAISPARFVRASMSIPYFYFPFEVKNIPNAGEFAGEKWRIYAGYSGKIPEKVKFVDGGLLSNFPIYIFHKKGIPSRPTFGARLSTYREAYSKTKNMGSYSWAIISTMRQMHDYDFILKNPDFSKLICKIDANEDFNWLNFDMSMERQMELFLLGARKGLEFLNGFDWEAYKKIRNESKNPIV